MRENVVHVLQQSVNLSRQKVSVRITDGEDGPTWTACLNYNQSQSRNADRGGPLTAVLRVQALWRVLEDQLVNDHRYPEFREVVQRQR